MTDALHILLVEDNPGDAWLFREAVRRSGLEYEVTVAPDGEQAMAVLQASRSEGTSGPDFIVVDVNLPRMNGRELLTEICTDPDWDAVPVAVLTSSDRDRDILRPCGLPDDAYFLKPHGFSRLVDVVRNLEGYRRRAVEHPRGA